MDSETVRSAVLEALEVSLAAQLKSIRALRARKPPVADQGKTEGAEARNKGLSQIDMAYDILADAARPLHVNNIISRIAEKFSAAVHRESLVSALSKRVKRRDRFERTGKNTFALIGADNPSRTRP